MLLGFFCCLHWCKNACKAMRLQSCNVLARHLWNSCRVRLWSNRCFTPWEPHLSPWLTFLQRCNADLLWWNYYANRLLITEEDFRISIALEASVHDQDALLFFYASFSTIIWVNINYILITAGLLHYYRDTAIIFGGCLSSVELRTCHTIQILFLLSDFFPIYSFFLSHKLCLILKQQKSLISQLSHI